MNSFGLYRWKTMSLYGLHQELDSLQVFEQRDVITADVFRVSSVSGFEDIFFLARKINKCHISWMCRSRKNKQNYKHKHKTLCSTRLEHTFSVFLRNIHYQKAKMKHILTTQTFLQCKD